MTLEKEFQGPTVAWFPAPVVLVSCAYDNVTNIITIAWTGVVCSKPPLISISIRPSRFSYELIINSGEFVINIPTSEQLKETELCGRKSGEDINKWTTCNFTAVEATKVSVPLIKECPVNIECKVVKTLTNMGTHAIFIGEVQEVHIDPLIAPKSVLDIVPLCYSPKSGIFGKSLALSEEI
ncbi:MAG: flavin reductase family protein [Candidatus Heimdallarchaeota archaeon]|nr:MAG: flavin reductase family protein [Candidatus Heimdallarchaeota archaeon]